VGRAGMSEVHFRVIRSTLDDEHFSGLFVVPVRSFPYELPAGTAQSNLDLIGHRAGVGIYFTHHVFIIHPFASFQRVLHTS
jgi:hypothetical protein